MQIMIWICLFLHLCIISFLFYTTVLPCLTYQGSQPESIWIPSTSGSFWANWRPYHAWSLDCSILDLRQWSMYCTLLMSYPCGPGSRFWSSIPCRTLVSRQSGCVLEHGVGRWLMAAPGQVHTSRLLSCRLAVESMRSSSVPTVRFKLFCYTRGRLLVSAVRPTKKRFCSATPKF